MTGIFSEWARSMSTLVRFTTACISGLDRDSFMKSFCMSCTTKAVLVRLIGGKGAPFMLAPFCVCRGYNVFGLPFIFSKNVVGRDTAVKSHQFWEFDLISRHVLDAVSDA